MTKNPIRIHAVGDIFCGRDIAKKLLADPSFNPFATLEWSAEKDSLGICNIECVIVENPEQHYCGNEHDVILAPSTILAAIRKHFSIASVANNHTSDTSSEALLETMRELTAAGHTVIGGGSTAYDAYNPCIVSQNETTIAIISRADFVDAPDGMGNHATATKPGAAIYSPTEVLKQIAAVKNSVDAIVLYLHSGLEFHEFPDPLFQKEARSFIDAGATAVINNHAHVTQGVEQYKHGIIAYGLGNFLFDVNGVYMQKSGAPIDLGMILELEIENGCVTTWKPTFTHIHSDLTVTLATGERLASARERQSRCDDIVLDPIALKTAWHAASRTYAATYFKSLYWRIRDGNASLAWKMIKGLRRREHRRWLFTAMASLRK